MHRAGRAGSVSLERQKSGLVPSSQVNIIPGWKFTVLFDEEIIIPILDIFSNVHDNFLC